VTATSFAWLGFQDNRRFQALSKKQSLLQANSQRLNAMRAELQTVRNDEERMLQALGRVSNIAVMKDERSLSSGLDDLAQQVGRTLEAEYCAVGLAKEIFVEDVAIWTSFSLSEQSRDLLEKVRVNPAEDSLIGNVLYKRRQSLWWDHKKDGDPLRADNPRWRQEGIRINADAAARYREILPGGQVRHMLLTPFYSPNDSTRPVGYFHLINHRGTDALGEETAFTQDHAESLRIIANQLAIAIENFRSHQRDLQEGEDEHFIARLGQIPESGDVFETILASLNDKLDSRLASLWLPIEDGFGPPEEIRKLVLRSVSVSGPEPESNRVLEAKLRQRGLLLQSASYVGRYLESDPEQDVHYQPDLSCCDHCWADLLQEIGTPHLLLLPILDPLASRENGLAPAEKFLAILCLRPRSGDFQMTPSIQERLRRFGPLIGNLILERRLKRRFEQIRILQHGLQQLQVEDLREFYSHLVFLVQEVMGAEACSLFLKDREPTELMLKASTAQRARVRRVSGNEEVVEVATLIDQSIYSTKDPSLTVETLHQRRSALVFNTCEDHPLASKKFREETETSGQRSFLGAPLINSQGDGIGVLRCINQKEEHRFLPSFLRSDLEFFTLLAGVVTSFIEGAQSGGAKRKFLREMAHEFTTPLLQAQTNTSFIDRYLRGTQRTKDPIEVVANLRDTLSHLQSMVRDIQFQLDRNRSAKGRYDFRGRVNLHVLVEQIRKPMIPIARRTKALEILGKTSEAPELYLDRVRFGQVLYNLLQNAVKYSRYGGPEILIEYELGEASVPGRTEVAWHCIFVSNYGIGVPEGEEELIFRESVRGSNTQFVSIGQSGTGLGLSVAREIVERHGGALRLERRDDPTVFSILLPQSLEKEPWHEDPAR
jgi:signal transduction histidine kinase